MCETIASFSPIRALSKVLLPALGFPNMLTNPDFMNVIIKGCRGLEFDYRIQVDRMEEIIKFISENLLRIKKAHTSLQLVAKRGIEPLTFGL